MKIIVKLFSEITLKSKSVRLYLIKVLTKNISDLLKHISSTIKIVRFWDKIEINANDDVYLQIVEILIVVPGISCILIVKEYIFHDIDDICKILIDIYKNKLIGKTFCIRVKRRGIHNFTSQDCERYLGKYLKDHIKNVHIKLINSEEKIILEIYNNKWLLIINRYQGLGGFPIGTQGEILLLISGGFDSAVSAYMLMRRGCKVSYCFFNIGGLPHEMYVRNIVYYLWNKFNNIYNMRFFSIDFVSVFNDIRNKVDSYYAGIVLKRAMVRAASYISKRYNIQALATGEVLGQVSSQTLLNLRYIDDISNIIILRPLIVYDKEQIISIARSIGIEQMINSIPEYCGSISNHATAHASYVRIIEEESGLDYSKFDTAITQVKILNINDIFIHNINNFLKIEVTSIVNPNDIVLDIRAPIEQDDKPIHFPNITVLSVPFYNLLNTFKTLDNTKFYLLYCEKGIMSRLQASYLFEQGYFNVKIYRPEVHEMK